MRYRQAPAFVQSHCSSPLASQGIGQKRYNDYTKSAINTADVASSLRTSSTTLAAEWAQNEHMCHVIKASASWHYLVKDARNVSSLALLLAVESICSCITKETSMEEFTEGSDEV